MYYSNVDSTKNSCTCGRGLFDIILMGLATVPVDLVTVFFPMGLLLSFFVWIWPPCLIPMVFVHRV